MIKRVFILLLASLFPVSIMAQEGSKVTDFTPKRGEWQFSLTIGNGSFFEQQDGLNYLLPAHNTDKVGLDGDGLTPNESEDIGMYLNLSGIGMNSMVNMIGIETEYYISDRFSVNAMFSMNASLTPKQDYVENVDGNGVVPELIIPDTKYTDGKMSNSWMVNVGFDYNFETKNSRITPYIGAIGGFRMARIESMLPYTGETISDPTLDEEVPREYYTASKRVGEIWGWQAGLVAGIDFSVAKGLTLGFSLRPIIYNYSMVNIVPSGTNAFRADNHNIQFFNMPMLKLGIRF